MKAARLKKEECILYDFKYIKVKNLGCPNSGSVYKVENHKRTLHPFKQWEEARYSVKS